MAKRKTSTRKVNGVEYYYCRVECGINPITGQRIRKTIYGKTVGELNAKANEYKKHLDAGINPEAKETFGEYLEYWLLNVHFKKPLKMSTKERYLALYTNYIANIIEFLNLESKQSKNIKKMLISKLEISKVTTRNIQDFYNTLYDIGVSSSTIAFLNKIIKPCLRYAYSDNRTLKDTTVGIVVPTSSDNTQTDYTSFVFTDTEEELFLSAIKGTREEVLYHTALYMGLRLGELLALRWSSVNFEDAILDIKTSIRRVKNIDTGESFLLETIPKTSKSQTQLPIPNFLVNELKEHKKQTLREKILAGNNYVDNDLVFATLLGKVIEPSNLRKRFKKILTQSNIPHKKFHALRHTFATRLFENGYSDIEVMTLIRHSDISTTKNIYIHITEERQRKIINSSLPKNTLKPRSVF